MEEGHGRVYQGRVWPCGKYAGVLVTGQTAVGIGAVV